MACMTRADLVFDPNDIVGPGNVVECWISQGPRADDASFDPRPGDLVTLTDEDGATLRGRVTSRDGNRVWVQTQIPAPSVPLDDLIADLGFSADEFE